MTKTNDWICKWKNEVKLRIANEIQIVTGKYLHAF